MSAISVLFGRRLKASCQARATLDSSVESPASFATRSAKNLACVSVNSPFISISDCGATVEALRSSQFGSMRGASNVSISPSGLLRRICT